MSAFIARQPNGRLCRHSTVVDCVTAYNMTDEEYIELCAENAREEARDVIKNHLKPFHPKRNKWVGYIIFMNGCRYYIAGDTDANADNKKVSCVIALVPVGGTYTMNASDAAKFVNLINPKIAIPTHYGSIVGKMEDGQTFANGVKPPVKVILKLTNQDS